MNIKEGDIIAHGSFTDVAILVAKVRTEEERTVVSGHWVNQGMVNSFMLRTPMEVSIQNENRNYWFQCTDPNVQCVRWVPWEQFKN